MNSEKYFEGLYDSRDKHLRENMRDLFWELQRSSESLLKATAGNDAAWYIHREVKELNEGHRSLHRQLTHLGKIIELNSANPTLRNNRFFRQIIKEFASIAKSTKDRSLIGLAYGLLTKV